MRRQAIIALVLGASSASADVRLGAALGAGGRGEATYSALDARFDGDWEHVRCSLGARGVWLDGAFRATDWDAWEDGVRAVRALEVTGAVGSARLAAAAGALAPARLAHVADGYRSTLDDRPRTGTRAAVATARLAITGELDDVLDPHLAGGALELRVLEHVVGFAAAAIDPSAREGAVELAAARRWSREAARVDAGGGIVIEPNFGAAAIGFVAGVIERGGARYTATAELRAGTGSVGAAFGPLHRIEPIHDRARRGVGAAASAGVGGRAGWITAGVRARPELGPLATLAVGAPAGRRVQLGAWLAASRRDAAGAGELRVAWARRLASALELARMYDADAVMPRAIWSATAWFAVSSE